jgi:hypothetical protein
LLPSSEFIFAMSLFDWPITKKVLKEVFTWNIEKCKSLCPSTYIGSKRMMTLGKAIGQSEVLLGTCWETYWEIGEHVENPVRTWWEHLGNRKNQHGHFGLYVYYLQIDMQLLILWVWNKQLLVKEWPWDQLIILNAFFKKPQRSHLTNHDFPSLLCGLNQFYFWGEFSHCGEQK